MVSHDVRGWLGYGADAIARCGVSTAELSPNESVPTDALFPSDSSRLKGERSGHTQTLAGSNAILPSIVVHRATMRAIDGMHRLRVRWC